MHTCPGDWDRLVAVVLVFLWRSIQLDPRILSANGLPTVVFIALIFRPLLKGREKKTLAEEHLCVRNTSHICCLTF